MRWPVLRVAVAEWSMAPKLLPDDWLLVWRGGMLGRRPVRVRPGQLVIARNPLLPDMLVVKRAAWREPDGGWWLTSDNPGAGGVDSFRFGPVPPELIEGTVLLRYRRDRRAG